MSLLRRSGHQGPRLRDGFPAGHELPEEIAAGVAALL